MRFFFIALIVFFTRIFAEVVPSVIIGGGIGGLTAGLYLARGGIQPIIIEGKLPSQITEAYVVENWPGEEKISGFKLIDKLKKQAVSNGSIILPKEVVNVDFSKKPYKITIKNPYKNEEETILTNSCIIATGSRSKKLNAAGENTYNAKGVSYCALCDGSLYKNKVIAVVGGGDSAASEAIYLSNIAKKVYVIVRKDDFKATIDRKNKELLLQKPNIQVLFHSEISSINGNKENVTEIVLKEKNETLPVDGVFVAIGSIPNSSIFKGQIELDDEGYIVLKKDRETNKEGIFAIGDVTRKENKQAIIAASDGALAAIQVGKYLGKESSFQKVALEKKQDSIIEITSLKQFEKEIKTSKMPVIVDFYASWCGPCKMIAPFLEKSAKELRGVVKFLKVDVDKNEALTKKINIKAMPTLAVFDSEGQLRIKKVGSAEIEDLISKLEKVKNQPLDLEAYIANE